LASPDICTFSSGGGGGVVNPRQQQQQPAIFHQEPLQSLLSREEKTDRVPQVIREQMLTMHHVLGGSAHEFCVRCLEVVVVVLVMMVVVMAFRCRSGGLI
jgi:hypothetical protein